MKAYRINSPHNIALTEMDALPVGADSVKIKNLMCGISSSDLAAYSGSIAVKTPIIPVRRSVGFVSEVGEAVTGIQRGMRVVTYPYASCHTCKACADSRYYDCEKPELFGVGRDGFLSDFSVVSSDDVYAIPDRITDAEAVFIEHIALALNALSRLDIEKGDQLVVVGATVEGIILSQVAMYYQAVPIMVDMREDMLALAQRAGVYFTVNAVNDDVGKKILSLTGGHMANACACFVGSGLPLQNVCDYTARRGRIALIGRNRDSEQLCNINGILEKNLDLYTVIDCGKNYSSAINMLANHTVSVDSLYERIVPFAEVPQMFEELASSDDRVLKTLVKL